jgi:hypothetical protein
MAFQVFKELAYVWAASFYQKWVAKSGRKLTTEARGFTEEKTGTVEGTMWSYDRKFLCIIRPPAPFLSPFFN